MGRHMGDVHAVEHAGPLSAGMIPAITRSSVLLPLPDGPSRATISPAADVEVDGVEHERGHRTAR